MDILFKNLRDLPEEKKYYVGWTRNVGEKTARIMCNGYAVNYCLGKKDMCDEKVKSVAEQLIALGKDVVYA
jgi:hypothetical protein